VDQGVNLECQDLDDVLVDESTHLPSPRIFFITFTEPLQVPCLDSTKSPMTQAARANVVAGTIGSDANCSAGACFLSSVPDAGQRRLRLRHGVTSCSTRSTAKVSMLNAAPHWSACGTVCLIVHAAALRHRTLPEACRRALMRVRHRTPPEACRPALRRGVGAGRTQARAA
jgi:hypothetical protein